MREPRHAFTQRFRDDALERSYLAHSARAALRTYRTITLVGVLGVVSVFFADAAVFGSAANVEYVQRWRIALQVPFIVGAFGFGFVPAAWFARWWRVAWCVSSLALVLPPAFACLNLPDPEQLDHASAYISVIAVVVAAATMAPIGFGHVVALTLVELVALVAVVAAFPHYDGPAAGWLIFACGVAILAAYQINSHDREAFAASFRLDQEHARAERLLHNVLPETVADRLTAGESRIADRHDAATVLFADLVGFTPLAARLSPEALLAALDEVFSAFDDIATRHGLEKIKTIGDAYMVVGGVPAPREDHAVAVATMALAMRDWIAARRFEGHRLELRIGIHSGPVVAGVVGKQKFIYDVWGDTVNTASRMESSGVAGAIQVTAETEALLRARFVLEPRGAVAIKGKGELETWLLVSGR